MADEKPEEIGFRSGQVEHLYESFPERRRYLPAFDHITHITSGLRYAELSVEVSAAEIRIIPLASTEVVEKIRPEITIPKNIRKIEIHNLLKYR